MSKSLRYGSALSALALAGVISSCAAPHSATRSASSVANPANVGLATRAQMAMGAGDFASAVDFAERAVAAKPGDAGFRTLLGNAYFGSGRFASAEAAYRDSLTLYSNQPQVVLKLALVQVAQGKASEALRYLEVARGVLDPSDYGLALALAGQPGGAIEVLEPAARQVGADARVRQNLALAYAFSGDWTAARNVAAQDLAADQLDARLAQWMLLAKPARASDQVAALTGIQPAASDPGQPVRLALNGASSVKLAEAAPVAVPAPVEVPVAAPQVSEAAPVLPPLPAMPVADVEVASATVALPAPAPAPAFETPLQAEAAPAPAPRKRAAVRAASFVPKRALLHSASWPRPNGKSSAVVQLGAYGSPQRVAAAWNAAARRYSALKNFTPMSARFASRHGTVYRLSVKGFAGVKDASALCGALRKSGGACFVRNVAGDAPVRFASR